MKFDFSDDMAVKRYSRFTDGPKVGRSWYFNPILTYYLTKLPSMWATRHVDLGNIDSEMRDNVILEVLDGISSS